jgi:hypothetical protein
MTLCWKVSGLTHRSYGGTEYNHVYLSMVGLGTENETGILISGRPVCSDVCMEVKRPGREADHSPPSSADVKNA